MKSRLKTLLDNNQPAFGAQLRFGSAAIAELFGLAGFDWILLDTEHAPQSPQGIQAQLQGIGNSEATPIVRAAQNDPDLIKLYLDMGAMGIAVPGSWPQSHTGITMIRAQHLDPDPGKQVGWPEIQQASQTLRIKPHRSLPQNWSYQVNFDDLML